MGNGNCFSRESFPDTLTLKVNRIFSFISVPTFEETHQPAHNNVNATSLFLLLTLWTLLVTSQLTLNEILEVFLYLFVLEGLKNDIVTASDQIHITYVICQKKSMTIIPWYHSLTAEMKDERTEDLRSCHLKNILF